MTPKNTTTLIIVCVVCCMLIYATTLLTQDKIRQNKEQHELTILNTVITQKYDNNPLQDYVEIETTTYYGAETILRVYRLRKNNNVTGLVIRPILARGYNGIIELIVGLETNGSIMGVNVLNHRETENIGDQVHQDKTDWIKVFNGMSVENNPTENWAIKREGGSIDQISGATTSSRAVVSAIKHFVEYYQYNQQEFFTP